MLHLTSFNRVFEKWGRRWGTLGKAWLMWHKATGGKALSTYSSLAVPHPTSGMASRMWVALVSISRQHSETKSELVLVSLSFSFCLYLCWIFTKRVQYMVSTLHVTFNGKYCYQLLHFSSLSYKMLYTFVSVYPITTVFGIPWKTWNILNLG